MALSAKETAQIAIEQLQRTVIVGAVLSLLDCRGPTTCDIQYVYDAAVNDWQIVLEEGQAIHCGKELSTIGENLKYLRNCNILQVRQISKIAELRS